MMHMLTFLLCLAGFAAFALATDRQQGDLFARPLPRPLTRGLRAAGTCFLLLGLFTIVRQQGWGLGLVIFSGQTSASAGLVYCMLITCARRKAGT